MSNKLPAGLTVGQIERAVQIVAQNAGSVAKMLAPAATRTELLALVQLVAMRICVASFVEGEWPEPRAVEVLRDALRVAYEAHKERGPAPIATPAPTPPPEPAAGDPPPPTPLFGTRKPSGNN